MYINNGVLYNVDNDDLNDKGGFTFPEGITTIGAFAFKDCPELERIAIPYAIKEIAHDAFINTALYKNPDNWENGVLYIDDCLIKAKHALPNNYEIKKGTRVIANFAFAGCQDLEEIIVPDSVTAISTGAFNCCRYLTKIKLPKYLTIIGSHAFTNCHKLSEVVLPNGITEIGNEAFKHCNRLVNVILPDTVTTIRSSAFHGCTNLESITVPDTIKHLGNKSFGRCFALDEVIVPNHTIGTTKNLTKEKILEFFCRE